MPADTRVSARRFDFSRETFDPTRHRRSVVSLQGRVTVEADINEQRRIDLHRSDTTTRDVIGPVGVPSGSHGGNSFKITDSGGDLKIGAGEMYVEGILCENEKGCSLLGQPDLPVTALSDVPGFSGAATYAVELAVWERDITPVDDSSILEKALGGPDTSGRTETVWQVVLEKQAHANATCDTAVMSKKPKHDGMLSARTVASAATRDCTLPPLAGYQGLENQLYRVEIHKGGAAGTATFKWSRENGSVVTGIIATPQSGTLGQTFTVQSIGADQTLGFADNQWIELIDDDTDLLQDTGILALIQHVDSATQQIKLTLPPGGNIDLAKHPKIRRWDQTDLTASSGLTTLGTWIALENGIEVRFDSGTYQPGDYWIIPARTAIDETTGILDWPKTPQPAQFAARHYARLAVVAFDGTNFAKPLDCRPKFDDLVTLTKRKAVCCCSVSVGDGKTSFGDYTSINDALAALPNGGEICVLAGSYSENVKITGKDIRIHGCHGRTTLTGKIATDPVISILDSKNVVIDALAIATDTAIGISIGTSKSAKQNKAYTSAITLRDLDITVRDMSAIDCHSAEDVNLICNAIRVKELGASLNLAKDVGFWPAIFIEADRAELLKNSVHVEGKTLLTTALGGIQIGGGSKQVTLRLNHIEHGNGNGITLGSVIYVEQAAIDKAKSDFGAIYQAAKARPSVSTGIFIDSAGCVHIGGGGSAGGGPPKGSDGKPLVPISEGMLEGIRILDNDILGMGGSGIADFAPPAHMQGVELVVILDIERNWITACASLDRGGDSPANTPLPGRGGIAIVSSEWLTIRDNLIASNGRDFTRSVCGIWTFLSLGCVIERNEILANGPYVDTSQSLEAGPRGGIVMEVALHLMSQVLPEGIETGFPAARINDNIVSTTSGPALAIAALGPVSIVNNQLTSHGRDTPAASPYPLDQARAVLGGCGVFVWNLAAGVEMPNAIVDLYSAAQNTLSMAPDSAGTARFYAAVTGDTMFNDNVVLVDGFKNEQNVLISAITVVSLGDISFEGNQCSAQLGNAGMFFNAVVAGWSLRLADNRFQETLMRVALSAITLAPMNSTTDNQGTHCFAIIGLASLLIAGPNRSLVDYGGTGICERYILAIGRATTDAGWLPPKH